MRLVDLSVPLPRGVPGCRRCLGVSKLPEDLVAGQKWVSVHFATVSAKG